MLSTGRNTPGAYRGIAHGASEIMRREGLSGFYRGLIPSLFGVSHGAIQFMAYEQLKHFRGSKVGGKAELSNWDYLYLSASSKIFAGSITYPYQVIRSRLQTYDAGSEYRSARDVVTQLWKREGVAGFYKGFGILSLASISRLIYHQITAERGACPSHHVCNVPRLREHQILPPKILESRPRAPRRRLNIVNKNRFRPYPEQRCNRTNVELLVFW